MLDQLAQMNMSIYFQTGVFLIFIALLMRMHWKIGSVVHILTAVLKYLIFIFIFLYIFLNWASDVNPSLRRSSLLIMTIINLYLLWHVILTAFELPYRRSLKSCVNGICTATDLDQAFSTGKRYYKFRYFWTSLSSGSAPWWFLRGIAAEHTRDDLHRIFINLDPKSSIFGTSLYSHYLLHQLAADKSLSADKRAERQRIAETLAKDPWLTEKTNDFIRHLLSSPEELLETGLKDTLRESGKIA